MDENKSTTEMLEELNNTPLAAFVKEHGYLTWGAIYNLLKSNEAQLATQAVLIQHYVELAAGDSCPYDKGECDAKAALLEKLEKCIDIVQLAEYSAEFDRTGIAALVFKSKALLPKLKAAEKERP